MKIMDKGMRSLLVRGPLPYKKALNAVSGSQPGTLLIVTRFARAAKRKAPADRSAKVGKVC